MGDDLNSKRMFFDSFKDALNDDKNTIINFILATIINRIFKIVNNVDINKITSIFDYIENTNRYFVVHIPEIIRDEKFDKLPESLKIIQTLNDYEKIFVTSICYNIICFSPNTIIWNINLIKENKHSFFKEINKYKNVIIQLLNFYMPIYNEINMLNKADKLLSAKINKRYVKVLFLTEYFEKIIKSKTFESICFKLSYQSEIIYYIIYQFLLCKDDIENLDINIVNKVYEILNGTDTDINIEELNLLLEYYVFATEYYSLEDKIGKIRFYRNQDLNGIINSYASMDIIRYNELQQKKKKFGL